MSTILDLKPAKYGITEYKKRELDSLTRQVLHAENQVTQLEAIVASLAQKSAVFQDFLTKADTNRTIALSNKTLIDTVLKNAKDLRDNSEIAFNEMVVAKVKTEQVAQNTKRVIDQLIYSAEAINQLANMITRDKSQNNLVSDELVDMITTAGKDANNAVALQLTALKAAFAAQGSNQDSEAACTLEYTQALRWYEILSPDASEAERTDPNLNALLDTADANANEAYSRAKDANGRTLDQLNLKTTELNKARTNLKSLQLALAAANAAALAS